MKNIAVFGLGLIGGSIASALMGFEDYHIIGVNRAGETLRYARENGIGDEATDDELTAVKSADVVFLCYPPQKIIDFLEKYKNDFKPGALVTDVCGIKTAVMEASRCLPDTVDFIGSHPMAGREVSGIKNSLPTLFKGAHYIITPRATSKPENIELLKRIAAQLGCMDVVNTTPEKHDSIIAYTSQAMHIMAVSVCDDPYMFDCLGYEGGSFRDCTRVAALDVPLWTELFSLNSKALSEVLERLEKNLHSYRLAVESGDKDYLAAKLNVSASRKKLMNFEHERGDDMSR
jgi:prephenate dehydrogenase